MQNLGRMATEFTRLIHDGDEAVADVRRFGCGEAIGLIWPRMQRKAWEIAQAYGFMTVTSAILAIEARTTDKWIYGSGLLSLIPEHEDIIV